MPNTLATTLAVAAALACALATAADAAMTISNARTKNVSCASGVCTSTSSNANLNVDELQTMLASSDVTVKATAVTPTLGVLDPLTWASTHRLTLDSYAFIHVKAPIVVEGTSGLTLITNDGGTGGDYEFDTPGSVTFWDLASSLIINGKSYTLVSDIVTLAAAIRADATRNVAFAKSYDDSIHHRFIRKPPVHAVYMGTFEGLGNAISNLKIRVVENIPYVGLFVSSRGTIRDITLINATVSGVSTAGGLVGDNEGTISHTSAENVIVSAQDAGGIAGANGSGVISGASVTGRITGQGSNGALGGLVGDNGGQILQSNANVVIEAGGASSVGGLAGVSGYGGQISQSTADAVIEAPNVSYAGGLVGGNDGIISFSSAGGSVDAITAGGLVGINSGTVISCRADTLVKSSGFVGGLVGRNYVGTIEQSFSTGTVEGYFSQEKAAIAGGLVGYNYPSALISSSYASGMVGCSNSHAGGLVCEAVSPATIKQSYSVGKVGGTAAGGAIGEDEGGGQLDIYWDFDTSGITNPAQGAGFPSNDPGITGLTDAQLKSALPAGFDPNIWGQSASINNGWPYLLANPPQ